MPRGLTAVISVKLLNPQFEGQTKAKLGNSDIRTLVDAVVSDKLERFLEENPAVGRIIIDKAMTASRAREAARKAGRASGARTRWKVPPCRANCGTATSATRL